MVAMGRFHLDLQAIQLDRSPRTIRFDSQTQSITINVSLAKVELISEKCRFDLNHSDGKYLDYGDSSEL